MGYECSAKLEIVSLLY